VGNGATIYYFLNTTPQLTDTPFGQSEFVVRVIAAKRIVFRRDHSAPEIVASPSEVDPSSELSIFSDIGYRSRDKSSDHHQFSVSVYRQNSPTFKEAS
jgi:hypothetical protein